MAKGGWKGMSVAIASQMFSILGIEISKNEEEGCIIARHPNSDEVIRRPSVTGCVEAVMKEWIALK